MIARSDRIAAVTAVVGFVPPVEIDFNDDPLRVGRRVRAARRDGQLLT